MSTAVKVSVRNRIRRALGSLFDEARKLERRRRRRYVAGVLLVCGAAGGGGFLIANANGGSSTTPGDHRLAPPAKASDPAAELPLTSILGVLRRPRTPGDLAPALRQQLARDSVIASRGLIGTPIPSLVRLATTTPWGQRIYLIPYAPPTAKQIARLPAKYRNGHSFPTTGTFSLYPVASAFAPAATLKATGVWGGSVGGKRFVFVVPDGVTKVAIWPSTSLRNHPHPLTPPGSKPIMLNIDNNVAAFQTRTAFRPGLEIWYGPSGKIVKRIDNASSCALAGCA